jgi:hypothetical protein
METIDNQNENITVLDLEELSFDERQRLINYQKKEFLLNALSKVDAINKSFFGKWLLKKISLRPKDLLNQKTKSNSVDLARKYEKSYTVYGDALYVNTNDHDDDHDYVTKKYIKCEKSKRVVVPTLDLNTFNKKMQDIIKEEDLVYQNLEIFIKFTKLYYLLKSQKTIKKLQTEQNRLQTKVDNYKNNGFIYRLSHKDHSRELEKVNNKIDMENEILNKFPTPTAFMEIEKLTPFDYNLVKSIVPVLVEDLDDSNFFN